MAVLPDNTRKQIWADFQREASAHRQSLGLTKPDLRAAANAIDDYFDTNTALAFDASAATTTLTISVNGFKSKV